MIVECGQCKTKFRVADDKITPAGVKVRCSKCKHIFTVVRGAAGTEAPASPARISNVEQPLSQPPGWDRSFGSQIDSKPIKKDSSWPPSAHLQEFQQLQVPDSIDQRMVDQIDLDSDAPLSVFDRDLPGAAPAPAPSARDDLFGTFPSPHAIPELPGPTEPPPLPAKPNRSSIAPDEAIAPGASPQADGGVFVGNDPFADLEGYQSTSVEGGSELTLDTDSKMFGAKPQTSPAPSVAVERVSLPKEKSPMVTQSAPLPSVDQLQRVPEKSPRLFWGYQIGFAVVACAGVLLLVMLYRSGAKPDLINGSTNDVLVKKITATTYPNINGHTLLVFSGEVHYSSNESLSGIKVVGHLLSDKGQLLGEYAGLAGVIFTPSEIYQMGDASVVADEYTKKIEELKGKKLPQRGSLPFMIVAYDHPQITGKITARVVPSIVKD
jgi:predicted Zn finger-like uncharacterized protein